MATTAKLGQKVPKGNWSKWITWLVKIWDILIQSGAVKKTGGGR